MIYSLYFFLFFFSSLLENDIDQYSYEQIDSLISMYYKKEKGIEYSKLRLNKSTAEGNKEEQIQSLIKLFHNHFGDKISLDYIDKAIAIADNLGDPELQFQCYHRKAYQKLNFKDYTDLQFYIKRSKELAQSLKNEMYEIDVMDTEAMMYELLDSTHLAINIYKESLELFENKIDKGIEIDSKLYLDVLFSISNAYNIILEAQPSKEYASRGLEISQDLGHSNFECLFLGNFAYAEILEGKYENAITKLEKIIPEVFQMKNYYGGVLQYLIKAYLGIGDEKCASLYLEELELTASKHVETKNFLKDSYKYFSQHFQDKGSYEKAFNYRLKEEELNKLLDHEWNTLENDLITSVGDSENIKTDIITSLIYLSVFFLISVLGIGYYIKSVNRKTTKKKSPAKELDKVTLNEILNYLKKFESSKEFLKVITLSDLAKACNTNTTYLSKVINDYKKKNFSKYINELRILHFLNVVDTDFEKFSNLTILGIAKELGFKSSKTFGKSFKEKTGKNPSEFFESKLR